MKKHVFTLGLALLVYYFGFAGIALGLVFDNGAIGTKAYFMGSAFVGIADDSSAIHYNPGGLSFIEKDIVHAQVYVHYQSLDFKYSTSVAEDESDEVFPGGGAFISKTYERWALGFGIYVPIGGGGFKFNNFQGINENDIEVMLGLIALHPAFSYRLTDDLSVGVGLIAYLGQWEEKMPDYKNEYNEFPAGFGCNVGLMYRPTENFSAGINMRSPSSIKMDGTETVNGVNFDSRLKFTVPYYFDLGFGYKISPDLLIGVHFLYMLWEDTDEIRFTRQGTRITNFRNSLRTGIGAEYKVNEKLSVIAGFKYVEPSLNKTDAIFPGTNEFDLYTVDIGIGYLIRESVELNIGGLYSFGSDEVHGTRGEVDHIFYTLGARFRF